MRQRLAALGWQCAILTQKHERWPQCPYIYLNFLINWCSLGFIASYKYLEHRMNRSSGLVDMRVTRYGWGHTQRWATPGKVDVHAGKKHTVSLQEFRPHQISQGLMHCLHRLGLQTKLELVGNRELHAFPLESSVKRWERLLQCTKKKGWCIIDGNYLLVVWSTIITFIIHFIQY